MLGIVLHKVWYDGIGHGQEIFTGFIVLESEFILLPNVTGQVADILMSPGCEVIQSSFEEIEQASPLSFFTVDHGEGRKEISEGFLE